MYAQDPASCEVGNVFISDISGDQFCSNGSTILLVQPNGGPPVATQWFLNGNIIPGATNAVYTAVTPGIYTATYTNGTCQLTVGPYEVGISPVSINCPVQPASTETFSAVGNQVTVIGDAYADQATTIFTVPSNVAQGAVVNLNTKVAIDLTTLGTSWLSEVRVEITRPDGVTITDWIPEPGIFNNVSGSDTAAYNFGAIDPTGTWQVRVRDAFDNSGLDAEVTFALYTEYEVPELPSDCDTIVCQGAGTDLSVLPTSGTTSYVWSTGQSGSTINVTQSGTYSVTATDGFCVGIDTIDVIINSSTLTQDLTICDGESVVVGPSTYTTSGSYEDTFTNAVGCDSVVTTNLTVLPNSTFVQDVELCPGESVVVGSSTYTTDGTYTDTVTAANGCDSAITTTVTLFVVPTVEDTVTICDGAAYSIGSSTYTTSGSYTDILTATNGCDSIVNTELTVLAPITADNPQAVCPGGSYTIGSSTYTAAGTYTDVLVATNGCDSTVTTILTVQASVSSSQDIEICDGGSYTIGTSIYTTSGTYTDVLVASSGCDSTVTTNLTVAAPIMTTFDATVCAGDTLTLGGTDYTVSGTYTEVLTSAQGCDSTVTVTLTVDAEITGADAVDICEGETYTIGSSSYTTAGTYVDTLTAANGCDSIHTTVLSITPTVTSSQTIDICNGDSYSIGSSTYTASGVYQDTITAAFTGCDSIVTTTLNVTDQVSGSQVLTICQGESVAVGSSVYTFTGIFTDTITAVAGCDSIVTTDLTVLTVFTPVVDVTICQGETYTVGSSTYDTEGTYTDALVSTNGCDSIITTNLTVASTFTTDLVESICEGDFYQVGNSIYTLTGNYTDLLTSVDGCDSIVTLALTVTDLIEITNDVSICIGESYTEGTSVYTASGTYTDTYVSASGCDSIVTTNLTVTDNIQTTDEVSLCFGEEFWGVEYTTNGTDQATFTASGGCDSTVTYNITVAPEIFVNVVVIPEGCGGASGNLVASASGGSGSGYQYFWSNGGTGTTQGGVSTGDYTVTVVDSDGCSTTADASVTPGDGITTAFVVENVSCAGGSNGMISASVTNAVLPLTYQWSTGSTEPIISGLSAGSYIFTVTDAEGCQFAASVFVNEPIPLFANIATTPADEGNNGTATAIVSGGTPPYQYQWSNGGDFVYIDDLQPGDYTLTVLDANGCTFFTTVTVSDQPVSVLTLPGMTAFDILPNPTYGQFVAELAFEQLTEVTLTVYDLQGRMVQALPVVSGTAIVQPIDISALPAGQYLLVARSGGDIATRRVVKR